MDKYIILNEIGQGYFNKVYLVENTIDKSKYALKFCDKSDKYYSYILNEIEILKKLHHTNIIEMKEYFHDEKKTYIILEYFDSNTLEKTIVENLHFDKKKIANQIIEGLKHIHSIGYVHGDLTLNNILVNKEDNIKIIDFGFSKLENQTTKLHGEFVPRELIFTSPEIIKYGKVSQASDMWSLGIILFKLFSGKFPFEGNTSKTISLRILEKPINYDKINEKKLLKKLLNKDPKKRITIKDL
jgi:serine/threonine protein kinase